MTDKEEKIEEPEKIIRNKTLNLQQKFVEIRKIIRKGEDAGYQKESINEMIRNQYGQADPHMMTRTQYDNICRYLDEEKKGEQQNV